MAHQSQSSVACFQTGASFGGNAGYCQSVKNTKENSSAWLDAKGVLSNEDSSRGGAREG